MPKDPINPKSKKISFIPLVSGGANFVRILKSDLQTELASINDAGFAIRFKATSNGFTFRFGGVGGVDIDQNKLELYTDLNTPYTQSNNVMAVFNTANQAVIAENSYEDFEYISGALNKEFFYIDRQDLFTLPGNVYYFSKSIMMYGSSVHALADNNIYLTIKVETPDTMISSSSSSSSTVAKVVMASPCPPEWKKGSGGIQK